ncbi:MAG TPA: hypothetical protein VMI34_14560 [Candidatus Bathyarchaeia archaeon]|nr:hypothetical protein [Candidatus Bathyarchaeia archaeon]
MTPSRLVTIEEASEAAGDALRQLVERGLAGCRGQESRQVREVFVQLVGALNFDYEEAAERLFALYEECIHAVRRRRFEQPLRVLQYLEAAWARSPVPLARPRS